MQFFINGKTVDADFDLRTSLLDLLRDHLDLPGSKKGCNQGACGACTVLVDGERILSCLALAVQYQGRSITTIEGLAKDGNLHPVQQAFWEHHGLQCGFCTPGMIMATTQLLQRNPDPTEEEIRHGIEGNLCRCTGYQHIVQAVQCAAKKMKSKSVATR